MATAAVRKELTDEECPVCHEQYSHPKMLHCGHLLCHQCLISWMRAETEASCPLCRSTILEPEDKQGKTFEEFADSLPTDLTMETLVDCEQILNQDHPCQVCVTQVAKSLCITCGDFFCSSCVLGHKRSTVSRHHTVEELSTLTAEKLASSRPCPCSSHSGEVCRVYCPTHGETLCLLCATTTHRQCSGVMELDTKVQEDFATLLDLSATLSVEEAVLEQAIQQQDRYLQEVEKSIKAAIVEIDANCDLLDAALKANRQRLKDLCHALLADSREAVSKNKTGLFRRRGRLTTHNRAVQRVHRVTKADVIGAMTLAMKAKVEDLRCGTQLPGDGATDIPVLTLVMDPKVVSRLERDLLELGDVKTQPAAAAGQEEPPVLRFPSYHWRNILLSNSKLTAERKSRFGKGIVMSHDTMQVNMLYEVRLDSTVKGRLERDDRLGVVTVSPDMITLPYNTDRLESAVVLGPTILRVNGVETKSSVGAALWQVDEGSRVGLMLDSQRDLWWYRDGKREGMVTRHLPDPCFFMIELYRFWAKVTALPVQRMA